MKIEISDGDEGLWSNRCVLFRFVAAVDPCCDAPGKEPVEDFTLAD